MWILLFFITSLSWAMPVLHFIKPESNFTMITTLGACSTYLNTADIVGCNPALFPYQADNSLRLGVGTITDGESVEVGKKLLFDPIKEEYLREIFQKRSFNSWGGNTNIELRTTKFYLGYDPISVNADIFVFNPSSPEVAMSLVKSNRLHISSGLEVINNKTIKASLGVKAYYYRSEIYQDSFFLTDLVGQDIDEIVKLEKKSGVAADVGGLIQFDSAYLPKISFLIKNLNSQIRNKENDIVAENQLRPLMVYETYSSLGLGYDFKRNWGVINTELGIPFKDVYQEIYSEYIAMSLGYSLSRFGTQVSYSKYQQVVGFYFGSKIANIGIFYGSSRPLGDFSSQTESVAGVRAEVSL